MDELLVKPGEAMRILGVTRWKLRAMKASGALTPVRFGDGKGRATGYSWFRRSEVERAAARAGVA